MAKEMTNRICVSIGEKSLDRALDLAGRISRQADVIEIRLDCLEEQVVAPFFDVLKKPLLFTNRPRWEGGEFAGEESERLQMLLEAGQQKAAYIDLEYRSLDASLKTIQRDLVHSSTQLILSWHDFSSTPTREELLATLRGMQSKGADIGKIVTTAHSFHDVLRVLQLQVEAAKMNFPLIAFCMGRPGTISRLATLELGGYMTYCSAEKGRSTAPGQLSVDTLRDIFERLQVREKS